MCTNLPCVCALGICARALTAGNSSCFVRLALLFAAFAMLFAKTGAEILPVAEAIALSVLLLPLELLSAILTSLARGRSTLPKAAEIDDAVVGAATVASAVDEAGDIKLAAGDGVGLETVTCVVPWLLTFVLPGALGALLGAVLEALLLVRGLVPRGEGLLLDPNPSSSSSSSSSLTSKSAVPKVFCRFASKSDMGWLLGLAEGLLGCDIRFAISTTSLRRSRSFCWCATAAAATLRMCLVVMSCAARVLSFCCTEAVYTGLGRTVLWDSCKLWSITVFLGLSLRHSFRRLHSTSAPGMHKVGIVGLSSMSM
mmetsp:Transcript_5508/g.9286  ORF Transcript_5508/g.9286 Transcript_5508/m.9286 type:complete len:312 (-) Transcript_5508:1174-2109(-)